MDEFLKSYDLFLERMAKAEPLAKSLDPNDFHKLVRGIDQTGHDTVEHTGQMLEHPASMQPKVDRFNRAIGGETPVIKRTPVQLDGLSRKVVYDIADPSNTATKHRVMVKPYHEKILNGLRRWQEHPILGWAEMANQALFHAANLGHLHQHVHVSEHNMGPRYEREPGLAIHMEPDTIPSHKLDLHDFVQYDPRRIREDATSIAAMDFLANNLDRHPNNLLVRPHDGRDQGGMPHMSHLLAIDHGRNFQYKASMKNNTHRVDPVGNRVLIPEDQRPNMLEDDLNNYLRRFGMLALDRHFHVTGDPMIRDHHAIDHIGRWWPTVSKAVRGEMEHQVAHIKNPKLREHILRNFEERANLFDRIAADIHTHRMGIKMPGQFGRLLKVPIHPYKP